MGIKVNAAEAPKVDHPYTQTNSTIRMQTIPSTDNQLSGTGKPGAIILLRKMEIHLRQQKLMEVDVGLFH